MNEVKNNSPKRPVIFYYAIALVVLLALNFLLVPWMSERSVKETGYNEFLSQVSAGNVTEVEVQEQNAVRQEQKAVIEETEREIERVEEERRRQAEAEAARKAEEERRHAAAEAVRASSIISFSDQDYEVLKRIVEAEAGGCDMQGRILVANVILNRVRDSEFPSTITDVVYQRSQFSPVSDGRLNSCTVSEKTVEAVNRALSGEDYSQGALFFMNRIRSRSSNVSWFDGHLTYLFQHEKHEFFR